MNSTVIEKISDTNWFNDNIHLFWGLLVLAAIFTLVWIISIPLKNVSIVDILWGISFFGQALFYFVTSTDRQSFKNLSLLILVTIWGWRLGIYILVRNCGHGEDRRYQDFRASIGDHYWFISLFTVFWLQAIIAWIVGSVTYFTFKNKVYSGFDPFYIVGAIIAFIGIMIETVADFQMCLFKKDESNKGKVNDKGLWHYSRHPNYFGESLIWWGFYLYSVSVNAWYTFYSPIIMTFLLLKVSGVTLLEKKLKEDKPQYASYIERTSAFILWCPKKIDNDKIHTSTE